MLVAACAGCATTPKPATTPASPAPSPGSATTAPAPSKPGYYKDDGPGDNMPANIDSIPDAVPRVEPLHRYANRPYVVFSREYVPATTLRPYKERGVASWYGRKFHGEKTSTGEIYDMYAMTAAHPTLPLPSYARVTSLASGKSVIVRVNDRGPFLHNRVIDLSYAAAHRIGIAQRGSGEVEVVAIIPGDVARPTSTPLPPVVLADKGSASNLPSGSASASAPVTTAALAPAPVITPVPSAAPAVTPPASTSTPAAATPPSAVAVTTETLPVQSAPAGYAVQLGAFSTYPNAQNFLERLQNQLASVQVEAKIRQSNGFFRVYVGPYAQRDEARRVAQQLETALGLSTTLAAH
jgi:rare lipoprotein A